MRSASASCSGANRLESASIATRKVSNEFVEASLKLKDKGSEGPADMSALSSEREYGLLAGASSP